MQTRNEAMLDALQQVDDSITGVDERLSEAVNILERSNYEHAAEMKGAALEHGVSIETAASTLEGGLVAHGKSIESAGDSLVASVIIYAVGSIATSMTDKLMTFVIEAAKSNNQMIEMVNSIWLLQQKYGAMDYNFVLDRSYASKTTTDERRTILNGLIMMRIIEDNHLNDANLLTIDEDSDMFQAYLCWEEEYTGVNQSDYENDFIEH
jgi:hypothetical protein